MKRSYHVKKVLLIHRIVNKVVNWWRGNKVQRFFWNLSVMYMTVYARTRCYGGPEEGGWYYNHYYYVEHKFTPFGIGLRKARNIYISWYRERIFEEEDIVIYPERRLKENEDTSTHIYQ